MWSVKMDFFGMQIIDEIGLALRGTYPSVPERIVPLLVKIV